jgi:hypothetical protein
MSAYSKYNHFIVGGSVLHSVHCLNVKYTRCFKGWTCLRCQEHSKDGLFSLGTEAISKCHIQNLGGRWQCISQSIYFCDPPLWHSATEHNCSAEVNSHLSPHFVAHENPLEGSQKPTTGHYLVPDEFILHPISD